MKLRDGISIIIPSKNRIDSLISLLESINRAKDCFDKTLITETIIVSDGSEPYINDLLIDKLKLFGVQYKILDQNRGPSYARNYGASFAQYNYLLFFDDDLMIQKDYFNTLLSMSFASGVVGVEGITKVEKDLTGLNVSASSSDFCGGFGSGNILYQKDVFCEVGGFDENYFYAPLALHFREDTDLGLHVLNLGEIVLNQELIAFHPVHDSFDPWFIIKDARKYFFESYFSRRNPMSKKYIGGWFQEGCLKTRQTRALLSMIICLSSIFLLVWHKIFAIALFLSYPVLSFLILRKFSPQIKYIVYYFLNALLYPWVHTGFYLYGWLYFENKRERKREAF
ncbi:glycosyltransferase [bacterium]|nr:glycosyltransferase [bacterium]